MHTRPASALDLMALLAELCPHQGDGVMPRRRYVLLRGQSLRHDPPGAVAIQCIRGTLWVTIEHDTQNIILTSGQCISVLQRRPVFVTAFDDAVVQMAAIPGSRPRKTWLQRASGVFCALARRLGTGDGQ